MKLFLASYRFGAHTDTFVALTGGPGRIAVVANAADSWPVGARQSAVTSEVRSLTMLGYEPVELDLRQYVGRGDDVRRELDGVDAVWLRGGNTFVLASAMHESGADVAITSRVRDGALAYAGYSAGACVASPSLRGIEASDDPAEVTALTGGDVRWDGLGLVDVALIPHYGSVLDEADAGLATVARYERESTPYLTLTDDQVLIVDGERIERI